MQISLHKEFTKMYYIYYKMALNKLEQQSKDVFLNESYSKIPKFV